jgi:uncharacterized protein
MSEVNTEKSVSNLLKETSIKVAPGTYSLIGLSHQEWDRLLQDSDLSPRTDQPFMIFRDSIQVTLLIEEDDWLRMRHAVRDAKVERDFRLVTLDLELPWNVVGYFAGVAEILAAAGVPIGALSSFSSDHLLIKQEDLGKALNALGKHVGELC